MKMSRRVLLAVGIVMVTACSSNPDIGSPVPVVSPTPIESAQALQSATATASPGSRTCVSSSEGPEVVCMLEAGTYRTEFLKPELTYTVPSAGWSSLNRQASPGNFHLFPPGGSLAGFDSGTTDDITMLSAVVAPGTCTGQPSSEVAPTFDGLVEFLTNNSHLAVSNMGPASVDGRDGTVMDITMAASDGCPDGEFVDMLVGVNPSHGPFGVTRAMAGVRLYLLHDPSASTALAIMIDDAAGGGSEYGDGEDWYAAAQSVIDSFVFSP